VTCRAYYNELDEFCAAWLRRLIERNLIAPGDVDERSIADVASDDLRGYEQCHFFAGIGVWSYALRLAGWEDSEPVWTGSCPCQPFSIIARGRTRDADARHLWPAWCKLVGERRPAVVFGEQVGSADGRRWLAGVRADLEAAGYAVAAADLCAACIGAPHIRQRLYWVGDSERSRLERYARHGDDRAESERDDEEESRPVAEAGWADHWERFEAAWNSAGARHRIEPGTFPLAHGAPARVGRLRAYGNALVAPLAAQFVAAYMESRP